MTRSNAIGVRWTVGNASRRGFMANQAKTLPGYPRSAPRNVCSRESHLPGSSWPTLPRTRQGQPESYISAQRDTMDLKGGICLFLK